MMYVDVIMMSEKNSLQFSKLQSSSKGETSHKQD